MVAPAPVVAAAPIPAIATAAASLEPVPDEQGARRHYAAGVALVREAAGESEALARAKKYQDAVTELTAALADKPGYAVALIARGSARIGLGKLQDSVQDYSAAHLAAPQLAAPLFGLAEAYRGLGDPTRAAQLYREFASSSAPDAQANLKAYALHSAQVLQPQ